MERYRTMRAYSAGGVVFRLAPMRSPMDRLAGSQLSQGQDGAGLSNMTSMEVALVGRSHVGLWALPKGTPEPGETIEQVAVREAQEETEIGRASCRERV